MVKKKWTILKNFMPYFISMVLQSVIEERAFLKINLEVTRIFWYSNFNEGLWNKSSSKPKRFPINGYKWALHSWFLGQKKLILVFGFKALQNNWKSQFMLPLGWKCWKILRNLLLSVLMKGATKYRLIAIETWKLTKVK